MRRLRLSHSPPTFAIPHPRSFFEEGYPGSHVSVEAFRSVVASTGRVAMDAEAWFRHHGKYANGEQIVASASVVA